MKQPNQQGTNKYYSRKQFGRRMSKAWVYLIRCDFCGMPGYNSEMIVQDNITGRGGLVVHKLGCSDAPDYSLMPFKVRKESVPKLTRGDTWVTTTGTSPFNAGTTDPMSTGSTV